MERFRILMALPLAIFLFLISGCGNSNNDNQDEPEIPLDPGGIDTNPKDLLGYWICYNQKWNESGDIWESKYIDSQYSISFYENKTGICTAGVDDGMFEFFGWGKSEFKWEMLDNDKIKIYYSGEQYLTIQELTKDRLVLKWVDRGYSVTCFFKREGETPSIKNNLISKIVSNVEYFQPESNDYNNISVNIFKYDSEGRICLWEKTTSLATKSVVRLCDFVYSDGKVEERIRLNNGSLSIESIVGSFSDNGFINRFEYNGKTYDLEYAGRYFIHIGNINYNRDTYGNLKSVQPGVSIEYKHDTNNTSLDLIWFLSPFQLFLGSDFALWGMCGDIQPNLPYQIKDSSTTYIFKYEWENDRITKITMEGYKEDSKFVIVTHEVKYL